MDRRAFDLSREMLALTKAFEVEAARAALAEKQKVAKTGNSRGGRAKWPMVSDRAGCMPNQVEEANANCRKMGLGQPYRPDGSVEFTSPRHRAKLLAAIKTVDFSS